MPHPSSSIRVSDLCSILKQLLWLLLAFGGVYGLLYLTATVFFSPTGDVFDTQGAKQTVYRTEPKMVVLARKPLTRKGPKIIVTGGSSAREGFRPQRLQPLVPGYTVHNIAVGGTKIRWLEQVVDLIYESLPAEDVSRSIVVAAIWYAHFIDPQPPWRQNATPIEAEKLRFGLYRQTPQGIFPLLPPRYLQVAADLLKPWLLIDYVFKDTISDFKMKAWTELAKTYHRLRGGSVSTQAVASAPATDDSDQTRLDPIPDGLDMYALPKAPPEHLNEQLAKLEELARQVSRQGARMLVVDLPIPRWHAQRSGYFQDYQREKGAVLDRIAQLPGIGYLDLQDMDATDDFLDYAHPSPQSVNKWCQRLAVAIRAFEQQAPGSPTSGAARLGWQEQGR